MAPGGSAGWLDRRARVLPPAEVLYTQVLAVDENDGGPMWERAVRGLGGAFAAILAMIIVVPVANRLLLQLAWWAGGSQASFEDFATAGAAYEFPAGMAASQLALAMLIPISIALLVANHRIHPRWLVSVQPGLRWRYLIVCLGLALVVLVVVIALSSMGQQITIAPQQGLLGFVAVLIITSPLQAAAEEVLFRGYLLQALGAGIRGPWAPVLLTAFAFALFHGTQNVPLFLDRFAFGVLAGLLVVRTGGLEAGIAAHVINNLGSFGWAGLTSTIATVKATQVIGWVEAGWDVARFGAFALLAIWVGRRMNLATTTPPAATAAGLKSRRGVQ